VDTVEVVLPGGFEHEGAWRRRVWLRPWCGRDQAFLAEEERALTAAARTTALLARCLQLAPSGAPAAAGLARALTVGDREALLLALHRISAGERLLCVLTCPHCGERLDLELAVADLLLPPYGYEGARHRRRIEEGAEVFEVGFHLPTGGDQEAVAPLAGEDAAGAADALLQRCVEEVRTGDGRLLEGLPAPVARRLPEVLSELDPQAETLLRATCLACDGAFTALFDAGQFVQQEIGQPSDRLYREVHLLAYHYHWSEAEILALPPRARQRYLGLLAEALAEGRRQ
jgi:hypothetical protein